MAMNKNDITKFLNNYYSRVNSRHVWFGDMFGPFADFYARLRCRLKGVKVGTILIGPEIVLEVLEIAAGQVMYIDYAPAMAIRIIKDMSPGEHLTGAIMNTYTTLTSNEAVAVINIDDLRIFKLRVATKVERLLYES